MAQINHRDVVVTLQSGADQLPNGARYLQLEDIGFDPDGEKPTMLAELCQALARAVADVGAPNMGPRASVSLNLVVQEQGDNVKITHTVAYHPPKTAQRTTTLIRTKRWAAMQGELPLAGDASAPTLPGMDAAAGEASDDEADASATARREPSSPATMRRRGARTNGAEVVQ